MAIQKCTMYGVVLGDVFVAKGNRSDMRKLAKKVGGQVYNSPASKVGDTVSKIEKGS